MAYDKQTFTVGQVLTAAEQNQIEENIDETRRAHKGPTAPPQLVAGVRWIDDTTSPWIFNVYDGAAWIPIGTIDPTNDTFVPSNIGTFADAADGGPYVSNTGIIITNTHTVSTWESIGPTGSAADNIWTAMDNLPSDIDWIEARVKTNISVTGGTIAGVKFFARKTGSVVTGDDTEILDFTVSGPTGSRGIQGNNTFKVAVDTSVRFDGQWQETGTTPTTAVTLLLTGYGYNP